MSSDGPSGPKIEVFAVHGVEPEVQAYAMAKYSRSALSMKESLKQISEQKAEQFLNTFYFQYGHRSIADLAHIALAIERLSILAAIAVVDEQRWDGQERSTRYQDFKKSGYHVPAFGDAAADQLYRETIDLYFAEYEAFSQAMFEHLRGLTPRPDDMKPADYERTLKARAFDLSRYLLPLATNTSLGQIVNARTLETQISRLLAHTHPEVRHLGELLKQAAREPAYNVSSEGARQLVEEIRKLDAALGQRASELLLKEVKAAPTLVKYAEPDQYELERRRELRDVAADLLKGLAPAATKAVELCDYDPFEVELAATLLYPHCHHSYRQISSMVDSLPEPRRREIIDLGVRHRGKHDELPREFAGGQRIRFDILMDIGGFRDMHRHRRCVQIMQGFTTQHGFDTPEDIIEAGLDLRYKNTMQRATEVCAQLSKGGDSDALAQYVIPLGYRKRTLFKMDFAEAVYISELRTGVAGHFSYRNIAWQMYEAVARRYPALAKYFRVTDVREPVDLLKR